MKIASEIILFQSKETFETAVSESDVILAADPWSKSEVNDGLHALSTLTLCQQLKHH